MPVTQVQIWRSLVVPLDDSGQRWRGHHVPRLKDIIEELERSSYLRKKVGSCWGYYWLRSVVNKKGVGENNEQTSAERYVRERLIRHALAQQKWKIVKRISWWFSLVPLVKMVGGSGSLAWFNTTENSDLDLFVVTRKNRIWTTRALLLIVSQLSGRRRKYWNVISPDKFCLNHYVTEESLLMEPAVRNQYMAQQYSRMEAMIGLSVFVRWWQVNQKWIRQFIVSPKCEVMVSRLYVGERWWQQRIKNGLEKWLLELPGDFIESVARRWQMWAIKKHDRKLGRNRDARLHDRVVLGNCELAFHPNTKVPMILNKYYEEEGQRTLL